MGLCSFITSKDSLEANNIYCREYGFLHILSSQYPNFFMYPRLSMAYLGVIILISIYFSVTMWVSVFISIDNVEIASENLHVALISFLECVALVEFFIKRPSMTIIHSELDKRIEYVGIQKETVKIKKSAEKRKKMYVRIWFGCVLLYACCVIVLGPLLRGYFHFEVPPMVNKHLILVTWTPFDSSSGFGLILAQVMIILGVTVGGTVLLFSFNMYLVLIENFTAHCEMLVLSLNNLHERALFICGKEQSTLKYSEAYTFCITRSIEHHAFILRSFKLLNTVGNSTLFVALLFAALIIACDGFALTSASSNFFFLSKSWIFMISDFSCVMVLTLLGDKLAHQNDVIRDALYSIKNFDQPISVQKSLIIAIEQTKRPMLIMAGKIIPVHLETFSNVVSASFSYYNILRTFKQ